MATSKITVSLDSNDKKIFTLMCKDIGITNPSMAINMWVKDCIRKQSILGFDCDIPEEVDENGFTKEERASIDRSLAQLDKGKVVKYVE